MPTIDEKRVYADQTPATTLLLAADVGVVEATVSGDTVGEFGLRSRTPAVDVAGGPPAAVAADEVRVGPELAPTGFGSPVAVGVNDGAVVAADDAGRVAVLPPDAVDRALAGDAVDDAWREAGSLSAVRAVDGPLIAGAEGLHRLDGPSSTPTLSFVGLDGAGVRDVVGRGQPVAATDDGLYALANGWVCTQEGPFEAVAGDGDRVHAVDADGDVVARDAPGAAFEPVAAEFVPVDAAYPRGAVAAASADGIVRVDAGDGWRSRALGVQGVAAVAIERGADDRRA